jgi:hypothetical protein
MLVNPVNDRVYLISKRESTASALYVLPATLVANAANTARRTGLKLPPRVSDAVMSRDGQTVILRTDDNVQFFRSPAWNRIAVFDLPDLKNPESVTIEPGQTTFLFGSEGKNSPVYRYPIPS